MRAKDRSNLSLKLKVFPHFFCLALAAHLTVRVNGLPVGTDILFGANGRKNRCVGPAGVYQPSQRQMAHCLSRSTVCGLSTLWQDSSRHFVMTPSCCSCFFSVYLLISLSLFLLVLFSEKKRSARIGSTWPWCWTVFSSGYLLWPSW